MLLKRYKINNNLSYFLYPTKKYKSFSVKIYFLLPYDKNKITIRNLLRSVLLYNTKKYNEVALVEKKKELYNLRINIDNSIINNMQQFTFSISGTNPKYFNDEEYTINSILEYLNEIIFNPNIENNKFNEESFNMCLNRYKIALKTSMEDKNTLAFYESINLIKDKELEELMQTLYKLKKHPLLVDSRYEVRALPHEIIYATHQKNDSVLAGVFCTQGEKGLVYIDVPEGNYVNLLNGKEFEIHRGQISVEGMPIVFEYRR